MRLIYTALIVLATPLVLLHLVWRGFAQRDYWRRWNERFGFVSPPPQTVPVWVHAASVGEVQAARPLIEALVERHGNGRVWVTTTTTTGSAHLRTALGTRVRHSYLPYDWPGAVGRFLDTVKPQNAVIMETELWPNLIAGLHRRAIPLLIANARLSPRSLRGYGRLPRLARSVLQQVGYVAAQSERDAQNFSALGAPRVGVMGNLKFDIVPPGTQVAAGVALRAELGDKRPVWIAASTHAGEDEAMLAAHARLLSSHPDAVLILVPRHPQRFEAVAQLLEKHGGTWTRRSTGPVSGKTSVLLGDSMGEMFTYLAAADLAFVGGSFVPVGGHNILEPAALGKPVLFGPHMHNFRTARELLLNAHAADEIATPALLGAALVRLFADSALRQRMGNAGQRAVSANRGALQRLLAALETL